MKISYNSQPEIPFGNQIFKLRKSRKRYPRRKWLPSYRYRAIISAN